MVTLLEADTGMRAALKRDQRDGRPRSGAGLRRELHGSAGDERLVAQGDQVLAAHGQRLEDVAAIGLVLLDQQMLRAGGDALLDDRLPVQRALRRSSTSGRAISSSSPKNGAGSPAS